MEDSDQPQSAPRKAAGFWIRTAAHAIDSAIILAILLPVMLFFTFRAIGLDGMMEGQTLDLPWWADFVFYAILLPLLVLLWRVLQATPGKQLCGLVVVDAKTGGKASVGRLSVRSLAYLLSCMPIIPVPAIQGDHWMPIPLCLGFLWVLISPRNYGWHDMVSGAITVKKSSLSPDSSALDPARAD